MADKVISYRVWLEHREWEWEVLTDGKQVAHGYEKTEDAARAQVLLFTAHLTDDDASGPKR